MFKTRLMGRSVLYGAEMDGIEADEEIDFDKIDMNKLEFVELKVKLREERESQRINYQKFKLRNWWCQCFLVNIRKILIGVRNRDGIVDQLMNLDVKSIPKQVQVSNFISFDVVWRMQCFLLNLKFKSVSLSSKYFKCFCLFISELLVTCRLYEILWRFLAISR